MAQMACDQLCLPLSGNAAFGIGVAIRAGRKDGRIYDDYLHESTSIDWVSHGIVCLRKLPFVISSILGTMELGIDA